MIFWTLMWLYFKIDAYIDWKSRIIDIFPTLSIQIGENWSFVEISASFLIFGLEINIGESNLYFVEQNIETGEETFYKNNIPTIIIDKGE